MKTSHGCRTLAWLLPALVFAAGCAAEPVPATQGGPMEARLAVFPVVFILCGVFCAAVIGLTALFRRSPAAGGVLLGVLIALVPLGLFFQGYARVRTASARATVAEVEVYPPGPRAEVYYGPPAPMGPVAPPGVAPPVVPPPGGMTRILSPEEVAAVGPPEVAMSPVEAPRPDDPTASVAAAPESPPGWVRDGGSVRDGDRVLVVVSGQQFADAAAAWRDAAGRAADLLRQDFEKVFRPAGRWEFDPRRVSAIRNSFTEEIRRTAGENEFTVYRTHLQVELSPAVRRQIEPVWREQVSRQRSLVVGGVFAALTAVAAALAGYFRLDARTGGRYRGRLKLGAAVAVAAAVAAALVVA